MKIIKRIYIYLVAFISFEVTVWAIIGLVRSIFDTSSIGNNTSALAQALSMIVVGGIVFWVHWRLAQKDAVEDPQERLSLIRAIFLYGVWASLIAPMAQNLLSLIYRGLSAVFKVPLNTYGFAVNQIASDNMIAIVVNGILAIYIFLVLKNHWQKDPDVDAFKSIRRIFRYMWKLYALGLIIAGLHQLLSYLFSSFGAVGFGATRSLIWGLSFLIIGLPLWLNIWQVINQSLKDMGERESLLRQVILYSLTFLGAIFSLVVIGILISEFLQTIIISKVTFINFFSRIEEAVSIGIPAGLAWAYFNGGLKKDRAADPHITRRSGMRRLYIYFLALIGIITTFIGLEMLVVFLADILFGGNRLIGSGWEIQLINIFTLIAIGLPVWLRHWLPMNTEAAEESEEGDHARRSVNRKGYLYILLFIGVIGIMFIAGSLLFLIISTLLGDPPDDLPHFLTQVLGSLVFLVLLAGYHWRQIRADNSISSKSLVAQHAGFPVVILESGDGTFSNHLLAEFKEQVPEMPVVVYSVEKDSIKNVKNAKAVILAASLLTKSSEPLSVWLSEYSGNRVVIPDELEKWLWVGFSSGNADKRIKKAVQLIEKMSEKQTFSSSARSPWVYVLIGLLGLPFLCTLINIIAENAF